MDIEFPTRPFKGYIFDCDGTMADTMPLHFRAWTCAMQDFGGVFPEALFYQWGGTPSFVIVEKLNAKFGTSLDIRKTVERKEKYYFQMLAEVTPIRPILEFAQSLYGTAPMAIASGGRRKQVEGTLNTLGIIHLFDTIVCLEDYKHGKPAPDPFLEAARRLGIEPHDCVVFEDTPTGIAAAQAAGMEYVLVNTRS